MRLPAEYLVQKYQENLFRAALSVCKRPGDAEDAVQEAFLQYLRTDRDFENEEHIKAWLIRTAVNKTRNTVPENFLFSVQQEKRTGRSKRSTYARSGE